MSIETVTVYCWKSKTAANANAADAIRSIVVSETNDIAAVYRWKGKTAANAMRLMLRNTAATDILYP